MAHAIVLDATPGITTEFVMNVVKRTGGYYESMTITNVLPDKLKNLAAHIDANYKAMANGTSSSTSATAGRRPGCRSA